MLRYIRMKEKGVFFQVIKQIYVVETKVAILSLFTTKVLICAGEILGEKLTHKSKNNQTDASCIKCVAGLCYIFYYFNTTFFFF